MMLRTIFLSLVCGALAYGQTKPASQPTFRLMWGTEMAGLELGLRSGPEGSLHVEVRNANPNAIKTEGAFVWLLIVQDRETAFYSEKIAWEGGIPPDGTTGTDISLFKAKLFPHSKGLKIIDGYPTGEASPPAPPAPAGVLADVVPSGTVMIRAQLYLPKHMHGVLLASDAVSLKRQIKWADLSEKGRQALGDTLLRQFARNEFAAKAAHDQAVAVGKEIVPDLLKAAVDPEMPDFGRMWLATTLVDIGDERAVDRMIAYLDESIPSVRYVVAFHGPRMANEKLDNAIITAAGKGADPVLAAWAARGFMASRRAFPDKLVHVALDSREPRARAEVAAVVAQRAQKNPKDADGLLKLIGDEHPLVRVAAARATAEAKLKDDRFVGALIAALEKGSGDARAAIIEALLALTGDNRTAAEWKQRWQGRKRGP